MSREQMKAWEEERRAVMLLSKDEVGSLFGDVANGLAFLVREIVMRRRTGWLTPHSHRSTRIPSYI